MIKLIVDDGIEREEFSFDKIEDLLKYLTSEYTGEEWSLFNKTLLSPFEYKRKQVIIQYWDYLSEIPHPYDDEDAVVNTYNFSEFCRCSIVEPVVDAYYFELDYIGPIEFRKVFSIESLGFPARVLDAL